MKNKKSKKKQQYLYRDANGNPEFAKIIDDDEWECLCGPDNRDQAFLPCDNFGNLLDGKDARVKKILCQFCGRIFHPATAQVVGRRNVDDIRKEFLRVYMDFEE